MAREAEPVRTVPNVEDDFEVKAREFIYLKKEMAALASREKELKSALMQRLEEEGTADVDGHRVLELSDEFEGVSGLIRQRRVSKPVVDEAVARTILTRRGLWERCAPPVPTISEDEIYACLYEEKLTEQEVFEMYPERVTYALVMDK